MQKYIELLSTLISIPSFSRQEDKTADVLEDFLRTEGVETIHRLHNNVWAMNHDFSDQRPTILLNSHHDTVKPNAAYTRDPFAPTIDNGQLYGLGSNDAGASLVSLLAAFIHFYKQQGLKYNLVLAMTGEEECGGKNGIESILSKLPKIDFAVVGEPTMMQMAVAERGLMVLDCLSHGLAGHAAREEGVNAILKAVTDIEWFSSYQFERVSPLFGPVKMSVTIIQSGTQHNVVPAECAFTVDVRTTECYTNEEVLETIRANVACDVTPRSTRLKPSSISMDHPIVRAGLALGLTSYGSPTTSDQALLSCPSLKMGAGDSARSHSSDEYVLIQEIEKAIELYIKILKQIL